MNVYPEERPVHEVSVDGFWMDCYEVTNERFEQFVVPTIPLSPPIATSSNKSAQNISPQFPAKETKPLSGKSLLHEKPQFAFRRGELRPAALQTDSSL